MNVQINTEEEAIKIHERIISLLKNIPKNLEYIQNIEGVNYYFNHLQGNKKNNFNFFFFKKFFKVYYKPNESYEPLTIFLIQCLPMEKKLEIILKIGYVLRFFNFFFIFFNFYYLIFYKVFYIQIIFIIIIYLEIIF
jgi:hypothetical protein